MYNKYISLEKVEEYDYLIDNDPGIPESLKQSSIIREVCRAGYYLVEELEKLKCPESILVKIQWTAGKMSYGRDPWEVHQMVLDNYKNNTLVFDSDIPSKTSKVLN